MVSEPIRRRIEDEHWTFDANLELTTDQIDELEGLLIRTLPVPGTRRDLLSLQRTIGVLIGKPVFIQSPQLNAPLVYHVRRPLGELARRSKRR